MGIQNHAGVVIGRFHHGRNIVFPLRVKPPGIVMVGLGDIPAVEGLVHHIHAQLVADVQGDLRGGIVGDPQGVEAVFFQNRDAAVLRII